MTIDFSWSCWIWPKFLWASSFSFDLFFKIWWKTTLKWSSITFPIDQRLIVYVASPAFLMPYMAIRLNGANSDNTQTLSKRSQLGSVMTRGAFIVGFTGGLVCLVSALWALFGRMDGSFGGIAERWEFLISYLASERLAYAFIWDIVL